MKRRAFLQGSVAAVAAGVPGTTLGAPRQPIRALCWAEGTAPTSVYPRDISGAVADALRALSGCDIHVTSLSDPGQGVGDAMLAATDVLFWWGHQRHDAVRDDRVEAIRKRVVEGGMSFVALHSSHHSKPFRRLLEASGDIGGVGIPDVPEQVSVKAPHHPLAEGMRDFSIPREEFYNEPFQVPTPDVLVFESTWRTGERFRSGCLWNRGKGRVFYFRPGHESFPTYFQPEVKQVMVNAARWLGQPEGSVRLSMRSGHRP
jgi:trehalose utilization protein